MTFFKAIVLFLVLLIIIGGGLYFYAPKTVSSVFDAISGKKVLDLTDIKCPETVPVFCETPDKSQKDTFSNLETAVKTCRVFGTFKIGNFDNIERIFPYISEEYKSKLTNWIESQKNNTLLNNDFDSMTTKPIEAKTVFSDEQNGQIIVLTKRIKIKENNVKDHANENCLIDFRKNGMEWKIENIVFSK